MCLKVNELLWSMEFLLYFSLLSKKENSYNCSLHFLQNRERDFVFIRSEFLGRCAGVAVQRARALSVGHSASHQAAGKTAQVIAFERFLHLFFWIRCWKIFECSCSPPTDDYCWRFSEQIKERSSFSIPSRFEEKGKKKKLNSHSCFEDSYPPGVLDDFEEVDSVSLCPEKVLSHKVMCFFIVCFFC